MAAEKYIHDPSTWFGLNTPGANEDEVDAVIFGIPYDGGVSYRGGAAKAPDLLRANTDHATPCTERLDYFDQFRVLDIGNFEEGTRDEIFAAVQGKVAELVRKGIRFTMIGGDHSVTIPVERGVNEALHEPFGIIHIDAHMDLSYELEGDPLSHGSTEQRALEMENITSEQNLYFIGIRSIEPDEFQFSRSRNLQVKTSWDCYAEGIDAVADDCIEKMKAFDKVYLTFDIDALDPAYAAGTGTPQFGGLTSRMAMTLIQRLFSELNIIGFDIVEIAPPLDDSLASMYAGRKILTEGWGHWAKAIGKLESFNRFRGRETYEQL